MKKVEKWRSSRNSKCRERIRNKYTFVVVLKDLKRVKLKMVKQKLGGTMATLFDAPRVLATLRRRKREKTMQNCQNKQKKFGNSHAAKPSFYSEPRTLR